jgi:DNA-binding GntR family transcriptional regulator
MQRYQLSSMALRGGPDHAWDERQRILEAVQAGNAEEAARLWGAHIRIPQQILESDDVALVPRPARAPDKL